MQSACVLMHLDKNCLCSKSAMMIFNLSLCNLPVLNASVQSACVLMQLDKKKICLCAYELGQKYFGLK